MLIIQIGELGGREAGHKVAQECAPGTFQGFSRWGGGVGIIQSRVNSGFKYSQPNLSLYVLSLFYTLNMTI